MAAVGDVLEQPEAGWKRYELSSYPINEYPQINVFEEGDFRIETPGNPEDKIKIGSKIRVFGKIANPISGNQADSLMDILIGQYPYAAQTTYPVMPLTDNKYTLLADIELTAVHFLSTFIRFRGNREYGYNQALFSAIDIFEEAKPVIISSLPSGIYTVPQTIELSCEVEGSEIRYLASTKDNAPAIEDVYTRYVNLYSEPFEIVYDDWNVVIYAQAWKNGVAVSEITIFEYDIRTVKFLEITTNKNILHFNILNFEEGKKYFLFLVQNNSLIKIYESSVKEFDISFKFDTEYSFCICDFYEGVTGDISNIVTVKTPIEKIIMPYGKTNDWKLNKNLIDEIYNFNFSSEKKKFQKFEYEYFLQSKKDNKYAAICNKRFADYFSFAIKMNLVMLEQGNLCKIISNCSEDNFYGWAIMNVKDEIFLRYNGFKTKNIKIPQNKKIELIVEFNNNNYINFYLEKELILVTKKLGDIIYNSDCYIRIGDKISDSNSSFLINKIELFNGIFTNDLIANPNIISIKNKKNVNIIKFTEVPESSFYKVLRSENKFGKYKEIGIVEKTDE